MYMTQSLLAKEKAQTRYLSENELRFTVPAPPSGVEIILYN